MPPRLEGRMRFWSRWGLPGSVILAGADREALLSSDHPVQAGDSLPAQAWEAFTKIEQWRTVGLGPLTGFEPVFPVTDIGSLAVIGFRVMPVRISLLQKPAIFGNPGQDSPEDLPTGGG